jgi:hypothetical protein
LIITVSFGVKEILTLKEIARQPPTPRGTLSVLMAKAERAGTAARYRRQGPSATPDGRGTVFLKRLKK